MAKANKTRKSARPRTSSPKLAKASRKHDRGSAISRLLPRLRRHDPVEVDWEDIAGYHAWHSEQEVGTCDPIPCRTLGYFLEATNRLVRVAGSRGNIDGADRRYTDIVVIPISNIRRIRRR